MTRPRRIMYPVLFLGVTAAMVVAQEEEHAWPRVMETPDYTITMYEP